MTRRQRHAAYIRKGSLADINSSTEKDPLSGIKWTYSMKIEKFGWQYDYLAVSFFSKQAIVLIR
jgi:hypothetical protein